MMMHNNQSIQSNDQPILPEGLVDDNLPVLLGEKLVDESENQLLKDIKDLEATLERIAGSMDFEEFDAVRQSWEEVLKFLDPKEVELLQEPNHLAALTEEERTALEAKINNIIKSKVSPDKKRLLESAWEKVFKQVDPESEESAKEDRLLGENGDNDNEEENVRPAIGRYILGSAGRSFGAMLEIYKAYSEAMSNWASLNSHVIDAQGKLVKELADDTRNTTLQEANVMIFQGIGALSGVASGLTTLVGAARANKEQLDEARTKNNITENILTGAQGASTGQVVLGDPKNGRAGARTPANRVEHELQDAEDNKARLEVRQYVERNKEIPDYIMKQHIKNKSGNPYTERFEITIPVRPGAAAGAPGSTPRKLMTTWKEVSETCSTGTLKILPGNNVIKLNGRSQRVFTPGPDGKPLENAAGTPAGALAGQFIEVDVPGVGGAPAGKGWVRKDKFQTVDEKPGFIQGLTEHNRKTRGTLDAETTSHSSAITKWNSIGQIIGSAWQSTFKFGEYKYTVDKAWYSFCQQMEQGALDITKKTSESMAQAQQGGIQESREVFRTLLALMQNDSVRG